METLVLHGISNALGPSRVDFLPDSDRAVLTIIRPARLGRTAQSFGQNNVRVFSLAAPVELIIAYCTGDWIMYLAIWCIVYWRLAMNHGGIALLLLVDGLVLSLYPLQLKQGYSPFYFVLPISAGRFC